VLRSGDTFEDRSRGTRLIVRAAPAETHGRTVVLEVVVEPNGRKPRLHVHPRQRQRVEVLAGTAGIQEGRRRSVVGPGARLTFPPGTPHRIWNAGDEPLQLVAELTPVLRLEALRVGLCSGAGPARRAATRVACLGTMRPALPGWGRGAERAG
jgi:mannose-6-phosphate isomerase-like protein (cupin superfamily)